MKRRSLMIIICLVVSMSFCMCSCTSENESTSDSDESVTSYLSSAKEALQTDKDSISDTDMLSDTDASLSNEELIAKFLSENVKFSRVTEDMYSPDDDNAKGMVGGYFIDPDSDGNKELILSRSLGGKHTRLCIEIYGVKDGKVKLIQTVADGKETFSNAYANNDVFLTEKDGKYYLCSKLYHTSEASGVPSEQNITVYELDKSGAKEVLSIDYNETGYSHKEMLINDELVYSDGSQSYKYSSLDKAAENADKLLTKYGLKDKIYEEKSLDETTSVSFEGYSEKSDVCRIGCRREVISGSLTTLQLQYNTAFPEELN